MITFKRSILSVIFSLFVLLGSFFAFGGSSSASAEVSDKPYGYQDFYIEPESGYFLYANNQGQPVTFWQASPFVSNSSGGYNSSFTMQRGTSYIPATSFIFAKDDYSDYSGLVRFNISGSTNLYIGLGAYKLTKSLSEYKSDYVQIDKYRLPKDSVVELYGILTTIDNFWDQLYFLFDDYVNLLTVYTWEDGAQFYVITAVYDDDPNFVHNTYYMTPPNLSFQDGLNQGYQAGYSDSHNNVTPGSASYNAGYNKGVSDGSNYSFLTLFGAIVDAPIMALTGHGQDGYGLLNFDFLGINLANFALSLFSLALVIFVLKLVLLKV